LKIKYPTVFAVKAKKGAVIPPELLTVVSGQVFKKKDPGPDVHSAILDFTKKNPTDRLKMRLQFWISRTLLCYATVAFQSIPTQQKYRSQCFLPQIFTLEIKKW